MILNSGSLYSSKILCLLMVIFLLSADCHRSDHFTTEDFLFPSEHVTTDSEPFPVEELIPTPIPPTDDYSNDTEPESTPTNQSQSTVLPTSDSGSTQNTSRPLHQLLTSSRPKHTTSPEPYWDRGPLRKDRSYIPAVAATCTIIGVLVIFLACLIGTHQIKSKQPTRRKKLMFHKKITVHSNNRSSRHLMKTLEKC